MFYAFSIQCAARRISYEFCRRNDIRHSQFRSTSLVAGDGTCVQCMMALLPKLSCHRSLKTPILLPELLLTSLPKYTQGSPEFLGILITLILEINGHRVSNKDFVCSFISRDENERRKYLQVIGELHVTETCLSFLYLWWLLQWPVIIEYRLVQNPFKIVPMAKLDICSGLLLYGNLSHLCGEQLKRNVTFWYKLKSIVTYFGLVIQDVFVYVTK